MPLHVGIATQDAIDSHLEITIRIAIESNLDRGTGLGILYRWRNQSEGTGTHE
jgi:hypothetical protein